LVHLEVVAFCFLLEEAVVAFLDLILNLEMVVGHLDQILGEVVEQICLIMFLLFF